MEMFSEGGSMEQEQMKKGTIEIEGTEYEVLIADTEELRETGLQGVTSLPTNEGMLFVFDSPEKVSFWMKDTYIPLDIIYISQDGEVLQVFPNCAPMDDTLLEADTDEVKYVLELNPESGVNVGDDVYLGDLWDDEEDDSGVEDEEEDNKELGEQFAEGGELQKPKMVVLDHKGGSQMELKGGERIFSRQNTRTLVRLSKRAYKSKEDKDYKALGRKVFKYLQVQDTKDDEYVDLPDTK